MIRSIAATLLLAAALAAPAAASDRLVAIDVLLEPDATLVSAAEAWNARLREQAPEGFELDAAHRPHITLLQQYVAEADLDAVLAAVGEVAARHDVDALRLTAIGLYHIPTGEIGLQGITIEPSSKLLALQADVVETLAPYQQSGGDEAAFVPDPTGRPSTRSCSNTSKASCPRRRERSTTRTSRPGSRRSPGSRPAKPNRLSPSPSTWIVSQPISSATSAPRPEGLTDRPAVQGERS